MKHIIILILSISIFSCKNKDSHPSLIKVNPSRDYLEASKVFKNFEIIPLEGNEKAIIAEVTKMEITPSKIYIFDHKQKKIILFSNKGKYLSSISNIGKGPNEYITLDDFIIHKNKLLLLSRVSKKIFQYDLNGLFEKTINLEKQYTQLANAEDETLVLFRDFTSFSKKDLNNIELFDLNKNKIIDEFCPFVEKQNGELSYGSNRHIFSVYNNTTYFTLPLQHKIFEITKNNINVFKEIDFGKKYNLPEGAENFSFDESKKIDRNVIRNIDNFMINKNYIYFTYNQNGFKLSTIINRLNNKIENGYITSDYEIPFNLTNLTFLKNNCLTTYYNPEDFAIDFYKKEKVLKIINNHGYLIPDLLKNNNPILVKLILK